MKIQSLLNTVLDDLDGFTPLSLGQIVDFTKNHANFLKICMYASNNIKSSQYLLNQCEELQVEDNVSDLQLAVLIVIISSIVSPEMQNMYDGLVSRASIATSKNNWSQGIATSYLLRKEVHSETIHQPA